MANFYLNISGKYFTRVSGKILIVFIILFMPGCLEDNITVPSNFVIEKNVEFLKYLEENNDFINERDSTFLIEAQELLVNIDEYLLLDLRPKEEFIIGHIQNAINLSNNEIIDYLININTNDFKKIVIISKNGQSSAYYASLLRLYGFNNVFSLNYGMANWNIFFASEWIEHIKDAPDIVEYTEVNYPKGPLNNLPEVFDNNVENVSSSAKVRIAGFIERGFVDTLTDLHTPAVDDKYYLICYGNAKLYEVHPVNAVLYIEGFDLGSGINLQTLPADKEIIIYDYNGQYGAALAAYLNVLGYKVKVLLFGACQLVYSLMLDPLDTRLWQYAFIVNRISGYPFVSGE